MENQLTASPILLIEDNEDDIELTLRALKKHKFLNEVIVLRDGAEALDYLLGKGNYAGKKQHFHPRVILLDLKLPKVSGLEVLRAIKSTPDLRALPVVVLTSSREGPDIEECYRLGVNSYVVKPVDFQDFVRAVSEVGLYWMLLNQPPEQ